MAPLVGFWDRLLCGELGLGVSFLARGIQNAFLFWKSRARAWPLEPFGRTAVFVFIDGSGVDQKKKIVSLGKGNLGEIKDRLCYPKFKDSSFFTESLG